MPQLTWGFFEKVLADCPPERPRTWHCHGHRLDFPRDQFAVVTPGVVPFMCRACQRKREALRRKKHILYRRARARNPGLYRDYSYEEFQAQRKILADRLAQRDA